MYNSTLRSCLVVLLLVSCEAWAKHSGDVEKLSFRLYRNHLVVVTGSLGGIEKRSLLIDTGARPTVIDESIAKQLGLKEIGRARHGMSVVGGVVGTYYAMLGSLDIGPVHHDSMPVAVADLSVLRVQSGFPIDGIVGLDALSPMSFQIDYESKKITFGKIKLPHSSVPMSQKIGLPTVELFVNGEPLNLMVDTGSSQLVLFQGEIPLSIEHLAAQGTSTIEDLAGEVMTQEVRLRAVKLGDVDLSGSTAVLTGSPGCCEFQGILGISPLHFKRISFDFEHGLFGVELRESQDEQVAQKSSCYGYLPDSCGPSAFQRHGPPR